MMLLADVPVQTGQSLEGLLVCREGGVGTCVIAISVLYVFGDGFEVFGGTVGNLAVLVALTVGGCPPAAVVWSGSDLGIFEACEEEELVLDDRTSEGGADRGVAIYVPCGGYMLVLYGVTSHVLVPVVNVCASLEDVRTGLGDGVDTAADESGLAYVKRRDYHLHLLDCVDGDWISASREV